MKIICVAAGSYKSFYINNFLKLKRCDLLIFNYGIIYNYDVREELLGNAVVTKELMFLSKSLHCVVVAGVEKISNNRKIKSIVACDGDKINIIDAKLGIHINVSGRNFVVGDETTDYKHCHKIVFLSRRANINVKHCSAKKIYFFIDKHGLTIVQNKKQQRLFNKFNKLDIKGGRTKNLQNATKSV